MACWGTHSAYSYVRTFVPLLPLFSPWRDVCLRFMPGHRIPPFTNACKWYWTPFLRHTRCSREARVRRGHLADIYRLMRCPEEKRPSGLSGDFECRFVNEQRVDLLRILT